MVEALPVVAAVVVGVTTRMMMLRWLPRSPRMRIPWWVMLGRSIPLGPPREGRWPRCFGTSVGSLDLMLMTSWSTLVFIPSTFWQSSGRNTGKTHSQIGRSAIPVQAVLSAPWSSTHHIKTVLSVQHGLAITTIVYPGPQEHSRSLELVLWSP